VKRKIDFKSNAYLPKSAFWLGIIALGLGGYTLYNGNIVFSLGLFVLAAFLIAPSSGIEIDIEKKEFNSYLTFFGLRKNDIQKFDSIEYVYIQRSILRPSSEYRNDLSSNDKVTYNGFLMFSGNHKIHIARDDSKFKIIKKCKTFSNKLGIPLFDSTSGVQVAIN